MEMLVLFASSTNPRKATMVSREKSIRNPWESVRAVSSVGLSKVASIQGGSLEQDK